MPRRVPRKPRPKKTNVPKGYDSTWEYNIHQTILQDWKHHWDKLDYVVQHTYEPDFVKTIDGQDVLIQGVAPGETLDLVVQRVMVGSAATSGAPSTLTTAEKITAFM